MKFLQLSSDSWILKDNDKLVGVLSKFNNKYTLMEGDKKTIFDNKKKLVKYFKKDPLHKTEKIKELKSKNATFIKGFPVNCDNPILKDGDTLPLFTKRGNSEIVYCAGYYYMCISDIWVWNFCPKLSTLKKYQFSGPYKSKSR